MSEPTVDYAVVIPTTGRSTLRTLLSVLADGDGPAPAEIIVVDDRPSPGPLPLPETTTPVRVLRSGGNGPAAARNTGWRATDRAWVAFLDDDVLPAPDWPARLTADLAGLPEDVGASQARITVPLPADRRPTDFERNTAGLADARWITADMAYRRAALECVGGFDERFPRAYREDADLALRVQSAGYRIVTGQRVTEHPVRPSRFLTSLTAQRGNADDALMRRRHGRGWRQRIGDGPHRTGRHALTTAAALGTVLFGLTGRRRIALACAGVWAGLTAEFAVRRIVPGPRDPAEIARMIVTSIAIPPAACLHRVRGEWRHRDVPPAPASGPVAVLFDRDGTLVHDVPYNGAPEAVRPVPGARAAVRTLRRHGIPVGVVTNQSGIARGLLSRDDVAAVNRRVSELIGPFDTWQICPHGEDDGCDCRKPAPGLVKRAAADLGVPVERCVVIGDIGADLEAALAAGARGILVPNERTRRSEIASAPEVAADLRSAVDLVLRGQRR